MGSLINKDPERMATLDGKSMIRVLEVSVGTVELSGLTVTRGQLQTGGSAAGILVKSGVNTLDRCIISSNDIQGGYEAYGAGEAIKDGTAYFVGCTSFENDADASSTSQGGGLYVEGGDYGASGGGIGIVQGQVMLAGCSIFENLVTWAGGSIAIHGGSLFAHDSIISDNGAYNYETKDMRQNGGDIFASMESPHGGGISVRFSGKVAISSCLIQNNLATKYDDDFSLEEGSNIYVNEAAELCLWDPPVPADVEGSISECGALLPFPADGHGSTTTSTLPSLAGRPTHRQTPTAFPPPVEPLPYERPRPSAPLPAWLPTEAVMHFLAFLGNSDTSGSNSSLDSCATAGIVVDSLAVISLLVLALLLFATRYTSDTKVASDVQETFATPAYVIATFAVA